MIEVLVLKSRGSRPEIFDPCQILRDCSHGKCRRQNGMGILQLR